MQSKNLRQLRLRLRVQILVRLILSRIGLTNTYPSFDISQDDSASNRDRSRDREPYAASKWDRYSDSDWRCMEVLLLSWAKFLYVCTFMQLLTDLTESYSSLKVSIVEHRKR